MKKIAIFMNSPYLGGAERSMVHQVKIMRDRAESVFFVPTISKTGPLSQDLDAFIFEHTGLQSKHFHYPRALFAPSRSSGPLTYIRATLALPSLLRTIKKCRAGDYDVIWANGNKVAIPLLLFLSFSGFKGRLIWHFRDYPHPRLVCFLKFFLRFFHPADFLFIANSRSVASSLAEIPARSMVMYNVPGSGKDEYKSSGISKRIGIVSMFAPWKGLHEILLWASLFEEDLLRMGVQSVDIYGGDIYQTEGPHVTYAGQLQSLLKKFPSSLVKFHGILPPQRIYDQIDLLIHSSLEDEPFGRVLIEAFAWRIPVISTRRGGSAEIVDSGINGLAYDPHDLPGLTMRVKQILSSDKLSRELTANAITKLHFIKSMTESAINEILA